MFFKKWKLHQAAKKGDIKKVTSLLEADPSLVNDRGQWDWTALDWASRGR